jgi:uncharacterized protein
MKKIAFLILLLATASFGFSQNFPARDTTLKYCFDGANLFLPGTEKRVNILCADLDSETSIEFAIVTIPTFGSTAPREYAKGLIDAWGIGKKQYNNGMVLVIAFDDRKFCMEAAEGLRPYYTQAQLDGMIKLLTNHFKKLEFDEGILAVVDSVVSDLGGYQWADRVLNPEVQVQESHVAEENAWKDWLFWIACVLLAGVVWFFISARKRKIKVLRVSLEEKKNVTSYKVC